MCKRVGVDGLEDLVRVTLPPALSLSRATRLGPGLTESDALLRLRQIAEKNRICKNYLGMGYYPTRTPVSFLLISYPRLSYTEIC